MKKLVAYMMFSSLFALPAAAQTAPFRAQYGGLNQNALTRLVLTADSARVDTLQNRQTVLPPARLTGTVPAVRPVIAGEGIKREAETPLTLDVASISYVMSSSRKTTKSAENIYVAQEGVGRLSIRQVYHSTNAAEISAFLANNKALTDDNRWEEDRVVSYASRNTYRAGRFLQVGQGVVVVQVELKKSGLNSTQWE